MSFEQSLALTVSPTVEGAFTKLRSDRGNWTSGAVGMGQLLGTSCGISACFLWSLDAADPYYQRDPAKLASTDIANIYREHFWSATACGYLHAPVAGLLFDAAVNQGPGWAPICLQSALGVAMDGALGPKTLAAAARADQLALHAEIARLRDARYRQDADWPTFGTGWTRRLFTVVAATAAFT